MAIKELKTRIALKYDLYSAWTTAPGKDLVLLKGELGICEIPAVNGDSRVAPTVLFKVGDGTSTFENLPWASAKAADVYSWAKASDVEVDGKTIKFIGGAIDSDGKKIDKVITLNFATPEEVETVRSGLDSRITAIENSIGNGGTVANDIADLKTRMGTAEGDIDTLESTKLDKSTYETYIDGKSMSDAELKKYAEDEADAAETAAKGYADTQVAGLKSTLEAADSALGGRIDGVSNRVAALEGDNGAIATGDAATLEAAKAYADGLAGDYDAAGSAATAKSEAIVAAKEYTDGEVDKLEAEDLRLAGLIGGNTTAIGTVRTDFEAADLAINNKIGTAADGKDAATVYGAIAKAQADAEANAATAAQGKVDALENGQVKTNKEAIATNAGEITRVEGLVTAEAKAREDADKALSDRIDSIDAFFAAADHDGEEGGLNDALDTLKEIQDYLNGEGSATNGMLGRLAQAETDIDNLEKEFNTEAGRVKIAEGKIAALEAKDTELSAAIDTKLATGDFNTWKGTHENDHAKTATAITAEIAAAVLVEENARKAADNAITDAIGTSADGKDVATVYGAIADAKAVGTGAASEAARAHGRLDVVEPKVTTLQDIVDGYSTKSSIKTAVDAAQKAADDAQDAADKAQGEIDALEGVVATLRGEYDVTKTLATTNEAAISALTTRVGTAEDNITTLQGIVNSGEGKTIRDDVTALQTLTAGFDGTIKDAVDAAKQAGTDAAAAVDALSKGQVATNKTNIEGLDGRVTAIENDYVKASDLVSDFYVFNCGTSTTVTHVVPQN